jgi:hypothetical protein
MKSFNNRLIMVCCALILTFFLMDDTASAQMGGVQGPVQMLPGGAQGGSKVGPGMVRLRRLPKLGRSTLVRTPEFQTSVARSSRVRRARQWAIFEVEYDTAPEWIDSIDISYSVMTYNKTRDGKDDYSLFQLRATYLDIQKGEHAGCVLLAPNTMARFGSPVALAVELSIDGTVLATESTVSDKNLPEADWWKNPRIIDSPIVTRRNGLLERSKTPFALINMDDYEVVK